jgi:hypothetical protein
MYLPAALLAGSVLARFATAPKDGDALPAASPALARGLDVGARLWTLGAGGFALAALPLAAAGVLPTRTAPPIGAWLVCGLALLPLVHALRPGAAPRARIAAALCAQLLSVFAFAQVGTAAAENAESPPMRAFARDVAAAAGDEEIAFVETDSFPLQFLLQRNVRELKRDALPGLVAAPEPTWVVLPEELFPALPGAQAVARSEPRPSHHGRRLVLARTRGAG